LETAFGRSLFDANLFRNFPRLSEAAASDIEREFARLSARRLAASRQGRAASSPLVGTDLKLTRSQETGRKVDL
jgi:hypothetical protein